MITLRNISQDDAELIRNLCMQCPPLDVHTPYTYWVISRYHSQSSFLMLDEGKPAGYILSLDTGDRIFFWQIGILKEYRGKGLSQLLIGKIMEYAKEHSKDVEVTIAADNAASNSAFAKYCSENGWKITNNGVCELHASDDSGFFEKEIILKAHYNM